MVNQTCKICGTSFLAKQSNYIICSDACRQINKKNYNKVRNKKYYSNFGKEYQRAYRKMHSKKKGNPCLICGKSLPDSRAKYCLSCLFNEYMNGDTHKAYKILSCRGYDKRSIEYEIENRR